LEVTHWNETIFHLSTQEKSNFWLVLGWELVQNGILKKIGMLMGAGLCGPISDPAIDGH
jgi:hypothetical protein